jgi:methylmalonyl-CoA/ethylmalonyl-CoA epimerase
LPTVDYLRRFDHIGVAVRDVDRSLSIYRDVMGAKVTTYKQLGTTKDYTFTQIVLGGQRIELIEPVEGTQSFLTKFLEKRGEGLHHLTFQVNDILATANYLKSKGLKITDEFYEDPIWRTAFVSPKSSNGVLIQLYETEPSSIYDH